MSMIVFTILLINGRFWCYCNGFDMLHGSKIQSFHGIKAWTKTPAVGAWGGGSQVWLSGAACREALRFGVCKKKLLSPRQTDVWLVTLNTLSRWILNVNEQCNYGMQSCFLRQFSPRTIFAGDDPRIISNHCITGFCQVLYSTCVVQQSLIFSLSIYEKPAKLFM